MPKPVWLVLTALAGVALVALGIDSLATGSRPELDGFGSAEAAEHDGAPPAATTEAVEGRAGSRTAAGTEQEQARLEIDTYLARRRGPASLTGVLRQNGAILIGARVVLLREGIERIDEVVAADTDELGRFRFDRVPVGTCRFSVLHDSVPPSWMTPAIDVREGEARDLGVVELPRPCRIRFRLVDPDGDPLRLVTVQDLTPGPTSRLRRTAFLPEPTFAYASVGTLEGSDDFVLWGLSPGPFRYELSSDDMGARVIAGRLTEGQELDLGELRMEGRKGLVVSLTTDGWSSWDEASVAVCIPEEDGGPPQEPFIAEEFSDQNRDVSFRDVPSGAVLWIRCPGFESRLIPVPDGRAWLEVRLERTRCVTGSVTGNDERPGFVLLAPLADEAGTEVRSLAFDKSGKFLLPPLAPGLWQVQAFVRGLGCSPVQTFRAPDDEEWARIRSKDEPRPDPEVLLVIRPTPARSLYFVDADRSPIAQVRVRLSPARSSGTRVFAARHLQVTGVTDSGGRIDWVPLWLGRTRVEASGRYWVRDPASAGELDLEDGCVVELTDAAFLFGRIRDLPAGLDVIVHALPAGAPMPSMETMSDDGSGARSHARVDPSGRFELGPLEPVEHVLWLELEPVTRGWLGRYGVPLLDPGLDDHPLTKITLEPGRIRRLDVDMGPLGGIEGRVLVEGKPRGGMLVRARRTEDVEDGVPMGGDYFDSRVPQMLTDHEGGFAFRCRRPGLWWLWAQQPGVQVGTTPARYGPKRRGETIFADLVLAYTRLEASVDPEAATRLGLKLRLNSVGSPWPDSFRFGSDHLPKGFRHLELGIPTTGTVQLTNLAPGAWDMQLLDRADQLLDVRRFTLQENQVLDLGLLRHEEERLTRVALEPSIPSSLDMGRAALYRGGEFVGRVMLDQDEIRLPQLEAGDYELRFRCWRSWRSRLVYEAKGTLQVGNDRRCRWLSRPSFERKKESSRR